MQFADFCGNEALKEALSAAFSRRGLPHTLVLEGESGLGKRTLARILARASVCRSGPDEAPCEHCPSCVRSAAGSHPDVRVITGSGASGQISAESVDRVIADASRKPEEADGRVYVFHAADGLSDAAQNRLLKLIEEPPPGARFFFCVPSAEVLLPTVRSRAQIFTLRAPTLEQAARYVAAKTGMEEAEAARLAALHGGNIGRMLGEGGEGRTARAAALAAAMAEALVSGTEHDLLKAAAPMLRDRPLALETAGRLKLLFRDACVLKDGAKAEVRSKDGPVLRLARTATEKQLVMLLDTAEKAEAAAGRNANTALLTTWLCARLRAAAGR